MQNHFSDGLVSHDCRSNKNYGVYFSEKRTGEFEVLEFVPDTNDDASRHPDTESSRVEFVPDTNDDTSRHPNTESSRVEFVPDTNDDASRHADILNGRKVNQFP